LYQPKLLKRGELVLVDKILVVDDELDVLNLVRMILEEEGYHVVDARDGEEALQKADSTLPDLILLDVAMPGKSGFEVCKILKAQAKTKHILVVMFTALGRDVDRKLGVEAGADGHVTKPFAYEDLLAEVKRHLERTRAKKFSKQLGIERTKLRGKKILFEFDPSTPYERLVRDFAMECVANNESVIALTREGSAVQHALKGDKGIELIDPTLGTVFSDLLEEHPDGSLSLVYDSLTDLALSINPKAAYEFAQNALESLSSPRITALFLLNPSAHEPSVVSGLKGIFSNQMFYGKQGVTSVRFV